MGKKIVNNTEYCNETPNDLITILEQLRENRTRITLDYGDVKTGRSWGDTCDITGRLSRSMGPTHIPILVNNSRSLGGGGILDHCIISIRHANKKQGGVIYKRVKS
jgi:hypothetical protein